MNLAQRYIDSVCLYIEHKIDVEVNSHAELLQQVDLTSIGTRVHQVVNAVRDEFEGNGSWVEMVNERLHNLRQELALLIRSIRTSLTNGNYGTITDLTAQMSLDWGLDAPTIAGIVLVVIGAENSHLKMLIDAHEVELGPIAQVFWNSYFSEAANEAIEEQSV